ncbi:MAG: TolC family protein, partial [Muribaculaceae bacterium]|nr:TolC family protein [Muribaculaceae bacterium]
TKAQQEQTLNTFRYTLMSAAADVHNAIDSYDRNSDKAQWLGRQVEAWQRSVDATTELFKYTDTTTYLELLTAQSGLLSAQMGVISCDLARTQAVISLYQSLGGGGIAGI